MQEITMATKRRRMRALINDDDNNNNNWLRYSRLLAISDPDRACHDKAN